MRLRSLALLTMGCALAWAVVLVALAAPAVVRAASCASKYTDISAGLFDVYANPSAAMDPVSNLLFVAYDNTANQDELYVNRCNLDGSNCSWHYVGPSFVKPFSLTPSAAVDTDGGRLLIAAEDDDTPSGTPTGVVFYCDLGVTRCKKVNITTFLGNNTGNNPQMAIDGEHGKLLMFTCCTTEGAVLVQCGINGTDCVNVNVSGQTGQRLGASWFTADARSGELAIVAWGGKTPTFVCDMDGTHCIFGYSGRYDESQVPTVGIDPTSGDLWVSSEWSIYRCDKHIQNCTTVLDMTPPSPLQGAAKYSRVLVDGTRGRAFVAVADQRNDTYTPGLFRCDFGGTGCDYYNISAGRGPKSAYQYAATLDESTGNVLVVTSDGSDPNVGLLSLFTGMSPALVGGHAAPLKCCAARAFLRSVVRLGRTLMPALVREIGKKAWRWTAHWRTICNCSRVAIRRCTFE
ncbi:MAG: hypothetical protein KIT86_24685 [Hydrogenophaga sp.]|uniref:hypothetical protein n=1 Tax=Hydrogenophaga sp. TaxID=1904254 RepID=UPI002633014B|nr:hypothetical protein [Hydrogenophaga sp.]MCW5672868.1 hypothetical protein [Hydrogenophaga sp.]